MLLQKRDNTFMALHDYKAKRNFSATNEPKGGSKKAKRIFVVQFHEARKDHYDFRLEHGGVLLSWAVPKGPSLNPKVKRLAVMVEDHPVEYADFEGEIPLGQYGGGMVTIFDRGTFTPKVDFTAGLEEGSLKFTLYGEKFKGDWALVRMEDKNWLLIKEKDEFAINDADDAPKIEPRKPEKKSSPSDNKALIDDVLKSIKQASLASAVPSGKEWLHEVKYDGYRLIASTSPTLLYTRNGKDVTDKFSTIASALDKLKGCYVFDGEAAAVKDGKIDFGAIAGGGELVYFIFDILCRDGEDLRNLSLDERKNILRKALKNTSAPLCYVKSYLDGEALLSAVKEMDMEGVVSKKRKASYFDDDWLKVKFRKRQEFVICGYLGDEIRSLLLGVYDKGRLRYAGKVGSGINARNSAQLKAAFEPLKTDAPTLSDKISGAHWLVPKLMAEVEFAEWTDGGKIRQPSFKGLRDDKSALSVVAEQPLSFFGVTITHPNKAVFTNPDITKSDVARYYESVAERMIPFLKGRPVSVLRCNDGIDKPFFVKHPPGKKDELIYIDTPRALINEVQLGTVEFHVVSAAGSTFFMVFDLDPDVSLSLDTVKRCALDIKTVLEKLKLKSFVKTSGGKGFHIVVPMPPSDAEQFAHLARSIAELAATKSEIYTLNIKKNARKGKIFIDWQRNSPSATAVAPYSLRARKGAPVSMPVSWNKLASIRPDEYDIFSPLSCPWKNFFV